MSDNDVEVFCRVSAYTEDSDTFTDSDIATLTVIRVPPVIDVQPITVTVHAPEGATFTSTASHPGGSPVTGTWQARARDSSDTWQVADNLYSDSSDPWFDNFVLNSTTEDDNDLELRRNFGAYDWGMTTVTNTVYANVSPPLIDEPEWHTPIPDQVNEELELPVSIDVAPYCANEEGFLPVSGKDGELEGSILTIPEGTDPGVYDCQVLAYNDSGATLSNEFTWTIEETEPGDFDQIENLVGYWNTGKPETVITDTGVGVLEILTAGGEDPSSLFPFDTDLLMQYNRTIGVLPAADWGGVLGAHLKYEVDIAASDSFTLVLIEQRDSASASGYSMAIPRLGTTANQHAILRNGSTYRVTHSNDVLNTTIEILIDTPRVISFQYNGVTGDANFRVDGVEETRTVNTHSFDHDVINLFGDSGKTALAGPIGIVLFYDRYLTLEELQLVESIAEKWLDTGGPGSGTAPNITEHPQNLSIPVGAPAIFTMTASGTAPLSYAWEAFDGENWIPAEDWFSSVSGTTTTILSVFDTLFSEATQVRGVVTNASGSTTSNEAELEVTQVIYGDGPKLLYTDLTSAPNTGWDSLDPFLGAAITVYGIEFGDTRGDSYVTVNGVNFTEDEYYLEPWNTDSTVPWIKRICVQLNMTVPVGAGVITVTVDGVTSNPLPFTVRSTGRVLFVDKSAQAVGDGSIHSPWQSPSSIFAPNPIAGDIVYFKTGRYDEKYLTGRQNFYLTGRPAGTRENPITFAGYPGDDVVIDSITNYEQGVLESCFTGIPKYWTIVKMGIDAGFVGLSNATTPQTEPNTGQYGYARWIDLDLQGCRYYFSGTGIINLGDDGCICYGSKIHNARTDNALDHSVYYSGQPVIQGSVLAWTWHTDCAIAEGPLVSINHQPPRVHTGYVKEHRAHSNLLDARAPEGFTHPYSRAFGAWHTGSGEHNPEAVNAEASLIYNNIFIGAEMSESPQFMPLTYVAQERAKFLYNTYVDSGYYCMEAQHIRTLEIDFSNNVCIMHPDSEHPHWRIDLETAVVTNNVINNGDSDGIRGNNDNPIYGDAEFTWDTETHQYFISATSSARAAAQPYPDFEERQILDFNLEPYPTEGVRDCGAVQYIAPDPLDDDDD